MKSLFTSLVVGACFLSTAAWAADSACDMQAADKKLTGAAKTSFIKKCEQDNPSPTATTDTPGASACETKAMDKKLAGAAKNSFMKKCEKDSKAQDAGAACEAQATEKKLYGAAKNSFVKKCKMG